MTSPGFEPGPADSKERKLLCSDMGEVTPDCCRWSFNQTLLARVYFQLCTWPFRLSMLISLQGMVDAIVFCPVSFSYGCSITTNISTRRGLWGPTANNEAGQILHHRPLDSSAYETHSRWAIQLFGYTVIITGCSVDQKWILKLTLEFFLICKREEFWTAEWFHWITPRFP